MCIAFNDANMRSIILIINMYDVNQHARIVYAINKMLSKLLRIL